MGIDVGLGVGTRLCDYVYVYGMCMEEHVRVYMCAYPRVSGVDACTQHEQQFLPVTS